MTGMREPAHRRHTVISTVQMVTLHSQLIGRLLQRSPTDHDMHARLLDQIAQLQATTNVSAQAIEHIAPPVRGVTMPDQEAALTAQLARLVGLVVMLAEDYQTGAWRRLPLTATTNDIRDATLSLFVLVDTMLSEREPPSAAEMS